MRAVNTILEDKFWDDSNVAVSEDSIVVYRHYEQLLYDYFKPISRQWSHPVIRFNNLKDSWQNDTAFFSSLTEIVMHPSYQQIIGMGPLAIPYILLELKKSPGHWFWALKSITGEDPIPSSSRGNLPEMTDYWLKWGFDQGYL